MGFIRHGDDNQGWTLLELLTVFAILAILIMVAIPSLSTLIRTQRLIGTTENLYTALQNARSEAIKRNASVVVSFQTGLNWCYGINTSSACNCSTPSNCNLGAASATSSDLSLSLSGISGNPAQITIESSHGAPNASGTMTFTINNTTTSMSVIIRALGSLVTCSSQVSGYQACT